MTVFDKKLAFPRLGLAAFDKIEDIYWRSIPSKEIIKVLSGAGVEWVDDRDWLLGWYVVDLIVDLLSIGGRGVI
jgi:hypothetical protein